MVIIILKIVLRGNPMNPSEGVREIESLTERLLFSLFHEPMPDYDWTAEKFEELISLAEKRGFERAREEAVNLVKNEPELEGNCPKEIKAQLSKLSFEEQARTHVRATKKNIENNIRNLTYEKKGTKNAKTN